MKLPRYLATAIALGASTFLAHALPLYRVTDLGTFAVGVNEAGQVAGIDRLTGLFLFDPVTGMQDLGFAVEPSALNARGQITGTLHSGVNAKHRAFVYTPGSGPRVFGTLTGTGPSFGYGINDGGRMVGSSMSASGSIHGFLYTPGIGMTDLGTLGGPTSNARAINNSGQIVGDSETTTRSTVPFIYNPGQAMVALTDKPGSAFAINDRGQVGGYLQGSFIQPFIWDPGTGFTTFGPANGAFKYVAALNNLGEGVGQAFIEEVSSYAFVYTKEGGFRDLNELLDPSGRGWSLTLARDINDKGQIVGFGTLNGEGRGFLLTPVPEPATYALMLFGLGAVAGWAHRRKRRS
jgi:probable HAF family extracellular repeat protein